MSISSWFSNLFYKQKPAAPPKLPVAVIYLTEDQLLWNDEGDLVRLQKKFPSRIHINHAAKRIKFDGVAISGQKLDRGSQQDEDAAKIDLNMNDWIFHGLWFHDVPGGIMVKSIDNEFLGCNWTKIGEDAISTPKFNKQEDNYCGLVIKECRFYNGTEKSGSDKAIQLNNAHKCIVEHCFITGGITGIRMQDSEVKTPATAILRNNKFHHIPMAVNINGRLTLTEYGNQYDNVKMKLKKGPNAKVK